MEHFAKGSINLQQLWGFGIEIFFDYLTLFKVQNSQIVEFQGHNFDKFMNDFHGKISNVFSETFKPPRIQLTFWFELLRITASCFQWRGATQKILDMPNQPVESVFVVKINRAPSHDRVEDFSAILA